MIPIKQNDEKFKCKQTNKQKMIKIKKFLHFLRKKERKKNI